MDASTSTAPWTWRLDPHSGSSSLGSPSLAANASLDPLSSLSHASAGSMSTDEIFWQDFRPVQKGASRGDGKRVRLCRFDSDEEGEGGDLTIVKEEDEGASEAGASPGAVSEDEDAAGLGHTSSEESDESEEKEAGSQGEVTVKVEDVKATTSATTTRRKGRRSQRQPDDASSSTHIIAHTIHRHALDSISPEQGDTLTASQPPPPLTYKETVRLVRLIAMLFRFPKSSRRLVRRRSQPSPPDSAASSPVPEPVSTALIELKPKYLHPTAGTGTTRKPRVLAHVHPEDARASSDAVLKLLALIPAALPARVGCAPWIVRVAVRAKRDEYGNILLPSCAYAGAVESVEPNDDAGKVTRATRQRMGRDAPAIPLPRFWRRKADSKSEEPDASHVTSASDSPAPSSTPAPRRRALNYSKLLAERMRDKRQAKTLLLRTHQSLRKRKAEHVGAVGELEGSAAGVGEREGRGEDMEVDAVTRANTLANSGRTAGGALHVERGEDEGGRETDTFAMSLTQDAGRSVKVKQEDV
ncbi:uncharacterized protein SRS1_11683 [Sporisorium reilianum f. sp. reilianum]|uniref:Uncharacterized protein n=1 Tax=Sporisorium reilianum f. sp. reilianum TaxID=72559 RepID=A0A2N8U6N5_9BASI|nr:uncharacterized protein SRS1_11683 [Sporisorium reilianum f. sp. reilianum]